MQALLSLPKMTARGYIVALPVALRKQAQEKTYHAYVTETLRFIAENTARLSQGGYVKTRYTDLIRPTASDTENEKNEQEIITNIKNRLQWIGGGE